MTTSWTPPTRAEVEAKIQEMVRRIVERFQPEKIILFGSRARGDAGPDSDVDLLVVMETASKKETTMAMRLALRGLGIAKDVVIVLPEEFAARRDIVGSIVYPAVRDGRTLYERSA